jgi:hypothetical protein
MPLGRDPQEERKRMRELADELRHPAAAAAADELGRVVDDELALRLARRELIPAAPQLREELRLRTRRRRTRRDYSARRRHRSSLTRGAHRRIRVVAVRVRENYVRGLRCSTWST